MLPKAVVVAMLALVSMKAEDKSAVEAKAHQEMMLTDAIAVEAANAPKSRTPREWSALLLTIIENETNGSLRIHEGHCKPFECDRGRARGPFQEHKTKRNADVWDQLTGVENTAVQVASASEALKRAYWYSQKRCPGVEWVRATTQTYAGRGCLLPWAGAAARVQSFKKFMGAKEGS